MRDGRLPIVIAGGGPAGLVTALELGRRGVSAIVVEPEVEPPSFPKANATTARTMEHFRRLGLADAVRAHALPEDYPADVAYFTRYAGTELARLPGSTLKPADPRTSHRDRWPTAEPLCRVQQMYVEVELRRRLRAFGCVELRTGHAVRALDVTRRPILVEVEELRTGARSTLAADYVVGADGPRGAVRTALGIAYEGANEGDRAFMGGRMLAAFFRSDGFFAASGQPRAWQYWAMNGEQRGLIAAIDGRELFVHHTQLRPGEATDAEHARACLVAAMGRSFDFELIGVRVWTAGLALVAERMADADDPRLFLVGDAAHLFTPTGGLGYNTAVDDAVNLGWKLAAVASGWGGRHLLRSYAEERRPVATRNVAFSRAMADSIGRLPIPDDVEAHAADHAELGRRLARHAATEFDIPGMTFGVFYGGSPVVCGDGPPPTDDWNHYAPSTVPGARAPHIWLEPGVAMHDRFGRDFTLLCFREPPPSARRSIEESAAAGAVEIVRLDHDAARDLYGFPFVLVRPDGHVAWRGDALDDGLADVLARCTGHLAGDRHRDEAPP